MQGSIILIGYRGAGKSTVARQLARLLSWEWVDTDARIEERAGKSIAEVFAEEGEEAFRDLESQVVAEFAQRDRLILAVGGGAVLRPQNRQALRAAGRIVWLIAGPQTILDRIAADTAAAGRRPNLTAAGGADEVRQLLAARIPIYRQCADLEIDTEGKSPAQIAVEILRRSPMTTATTEPQ